MRVAFIGDIVGKPGRTIIKDKLSFIKERYEIDLVIANGENASHGFGLSKKNADELFQSGIDVLTGGNHIWDKKDIIPFMDSLEIVRPLNYPEGVPGTGVKVVGSGDFKLAVINLMGYFAMPMVCNPFLSVKEEVKRVKKSGIDNIFIDFHAEVTSEKNALFAMLKGEVSAICGTHTHIGTDDLMIDRGTFYVSDVGLTGCRDGVIGMDTESPVKRFTTGLPAHFDIPKRCKKIFQIVIMDIDGGKCLRAFKLKLYDDRDDEVRIEAFLEELDDK